MEDRGCLLFWFREVGGKKKILEGELICEKRVGRTKKDG